MLFGRVLPKLRTAVAKDLGLPGLPRAKVMATIVKLLETTFIRIGNDEYARENQSFGLTTLRNKHVRSADRRSDFAFAARAGSPAIRISAIENWRKFSDGAKNSRGKNFFSILTMTANRTRLIPAMLMIISGQWRESI